jgi:hypothetical protein
MRKLTNQVHVVPKEEKVVAEPQLGLFGLTRAEATDQMSFGERMDSLRALEKALKDSKN